MRIGIDITALNGDHDLERATANLRSSGEALSSGFRINRPADESGLVTSERLRSQVSGLGHANRQVSSQNLTASESQITDTDRSLEMFSFTHRVLARAGTEKLAQASAMPQTIVELLR